MLNTPKNYKIVFIYFQNAFKIIEDNSLKNDTVDDIYYTLKKFLNIAFEKCSVNEAYCDNWLEWFEGKKSTVFLRDLFLEVGCDYWETLINTNVINRIDSLQSKISIR